MKILHLTSDNKFVDQAFTVFDIAFPMANDVLVLSKSGNLKFVKLAPKKIIPAKFSKIRMPNISSVEYKYYDIVVFHSFSDLLYPEIYNVPEGIPTIWLGWGYDYYNLIECPKNLMLPETQRLVKRSKVKKVREYIGKVLRSTLLLFGMSKSRIKAIERLTLFSPVLPNEYELVKRARKWNAFPENTRWNYGTIEDHLVKGFEHVKIDSNAILVGNSASSTCNHMETLKFLNENGFQDREIVAPLSYGDKSYGQKIAEAGKRQFGRNFDPLMDFMPVQDYVSKIRKCGYVIMNHKRQQAVGNIVIMLYLGARVFLREENPTYSFLTGMGVLVSSVQQLEDDPSLLDKPLSSEEHERNKQLVSDYWSRKQGVARTKSLVQQAFDQKSMGLDGNAFQGTMS